MTFSPTYSALKSLRSGLKLFQEGDTVVAVTLTGGQVCEARQVLGTGLLEVRLMGYPLKEELEDLLNAWLLPVGLLSNTRGLVLDFSELEGLETQAARWICEQMIPQMARCRFEVFGLIEPTGPVALMSWRECQGCFREAFPAHYFQDMSAANAWAIIRLAAHRR